ncbi:MAG: hypothetical protein ABFD89_29575 [Bryobacteraceae bacterium]
MATMRSFAAVPSSTHAWAELAGGVYGEDVSGPGLYLLMRGYNQLAGLSREQVQFLAGIPPALHTRTLLSGSVYGEDASGAGTFRSLYWQALLAMAILAVESTWEFGGTCVGTIPLSILSTWEFGGLAIGLVDGLHTGQATSDWEFSGEAEGQVTGSGQAEGTWEFGGTVTLPDGTEEGCITADGSASQGSGGGGSEVDYVF